MNWQAEMDTGNNILLAEISTGKVINTSLHLSLLLSAELQVECAINLQGLSNQHGQNLS